MAEQRPPQSSSTTLVIVAVVVAILAVVLVNVYIEAARRQALPGEFTVYRLTRSVRPGDTLRERDVEPVKLPDSFEDAFANALDPTGLQTRMGDTLYRAAERNAPLTYDLFKPPEDNGLDQMIDQGMRLVALPVDSDRLPGPLRPGMYVDLEAPFPSGGATTILPVMERVRVLAVGDRSVVDERRAEADPGARRRYSRADTISIEVTPAQATQLARIEQLATGSFNVQLRKPSDQGTPKIPTGGINPDVLGLLR